MLETLVEGCWQFRRGDLEIRGGACCCGAGTGGGDAGGGAMLLGLLRGVVHVDGACALAAVVLGVDDARLRRWGWERGGARLHHSLLSSDWGTWAKEIYRYSGEGCVYV